jgi:hypothetical protein
MLWNQKASHAPQMTLAAMQECEASHGSLRAECLPEALIDAPRREVHSEFSSSDSDGRHDSDAITGCACGNRCAGVTSSATR